MYGSRESHGSSRTTEVSEVVELRGGLIVHTDAIALILALEDRGIALTVRDGQLRMPVGAVLTDEEKRRGRELRLHLMALAGYVAPALG